MWLKHPKTMSILYGDAAFNKLKVDNAAMLADSVSTVSGTLGLILNTQCLICQAQAIKIKCNQFHWLCTNSLTLNVGDARQQQESRINIYPG